MAERGIIEGAVRTTLNVAGMIPVGIVHGLSKQGGTVDRYITENKDRIREVVGVGVLGALVL